VDTGQLLLIGGGLALLCVVLFILGTVLQVVGTVFSFLGGLLETVINLFNTGPVPGCGCVVAVAVVALCGILVYLAVNVSATCSGPNPVNFCLLFGG
jgi:uncharacterized membrane protein